MGKSQGAFVLSLRVVLFLDTRDYRTELTNLHRTSVRKNCNYSTKHKKYCRHNWYNNPIAVAPRDSRPRPVHQPSFFRFSIQHNLTHLRGVTTAPDAHTDVHVGEPVGAKQKHGLEGLDAEDRRFQELDRAPVHLDQAASALAVSHGGGGLLLAKGRRGKGGEQQEQCKRRRHIHPPP